MLILALDYALAIEVFAALPLKVLFLDNDEANILFYQER